MAIKAFFSRDGNFPTLPFKRNTVIGKLYPYILNLLGFVDKISKKIIKLK